jgi:hypothetical protein
VLIKQILGSGFYFVLVVALCRNTVNSRCTNHSMGWRGCALFVESFYVEATCIIAQSVEHASLKALDSLSKIELD